MALNPRIFGIVSSIKLLNGRLAVDSNKTTYWLVKMKGRPRVDCGIPNQWGFTLLQAINIWGLIILTK